MEEPEEVGLTEAIEAFQRVREFFGADTVVVWFGTQHGNVQAVVNDNGHMVFVGGKFAGGKVNS